MQLQKFNPELHTGYIKEWLNYRDMNPLLADELPKLGYILSGEDQVPVCAGFLREVEGNCMLLDSLITNHKASPESRDKAIDIVVNQLLISAKELGIKRIMASSVDNNTLKRSEKFGFKKLPHTLIVVDLT